MRKRHLLILAVTGTLLVGLVALMAGQPARPTTPPTLPAVDVSRITPRKVVRVVDGDTIVIENQNRNHRTVRLIGVDTPETVHPSKPVQFYGKEASRFLRNLLKGEQVYLVVDPQQGERDRYGRLLRYIYRYPDKLFVNTEIIRQGYGHAYPKFPFKHSAKFQQLERFARQAEKGLWSPDAKPPVTAAVAPTPAKPTPSPVVKPPKPRPADVTVYVTRTGRKYHRGSCRYLRKSRIPMKLSEAKARYGPCSVCGPPRQSSLVAPSSTSPVAENSSYFGQTSQNTGRPKTVRVQGYYRKDGTYVRGHYRSRPRR